MANLSKSYKRTKNDYDFQNDNNSILSPNFDLAQNNIWFVVRKFNLNYTMGQDEDNNMIDNGEYNIVVGDIVKIGRLKLIVTEMKLDDLNENKIAELQKHKIQNNTNVNNSPTVRRRETNLNINQNELDNDVENEFNYIDTVSVNHAENNNNEVNAFNSELNNNQIGNFFSNVNNNNADEQLNTDIKECKDNKVSILSMCLAN